MIKVIRIRELLNYLKYLRFSLLHVVSNPFYGTHKETATESD